MSQAIVLSQDKQDETRKVLPWTLAMGLSVALLLLQTMKTRLLILLLPLLPIKKPLLPPFHYNN